MRLPRRRRRCPGFRTATSSRPEEGRDRKPHRLPAQVDAQKKTVDEAEWPMKREEASPETMAPSHSSRKDGDALSHVRDGQWTAAGVLRPGGARYRSPSRSQRGSGGGSSSLPFLLPQLPLSGEELPRGQRERPTSGPEEGRNREPHRALFKSKPMKSMIGETGRPMKREGANPEITAPPRSSRGRQVKTREEEGCSRKDGDALR